MTDLIGDCSYTEIEPSDQPIARNTSSSSTATSLTASASTRAANTSPTSSPLAATKSKTHIVTIAVCVVVALLLLLSIPFIMFLCKRRREKKERYEWRQEAFQGWNAAYGNSEPKPLDPPIYAAHSSFLPTPNTSASSGSLGAINHVMPSPPPPASTALYNLAPQDERYSEQMRTAHSHMIAAKPSMRSVVGPLGPPAPASAALERDVQRSQTRARERELAVPSARQHRPLRAKRQYSNDDIATSRLSYASERTIVAPSQVLQPVSTSRDPQRHEVAGTREKDAALEEERRENERYRLRLRNARQSMMTVNTVNTVSAPPAYDDSAYPLPPVPANLDAWRSHAPTSSRSMGDIASTPGLPSTSAQNRNRRVTKASMLQSPWDQSGSGEDDDFGGKTLVETYPIRGAFGSAGQGTYGKAPIHTLAPASG